jgi:hypothetical protein
LKKNIKNLFFTILFFVFGTSFIQAQFFKDNFYYEGEVGAITSFFVTSPNGETSVFTVGGLSFRGGLGIHNNENSLFLGINSGIEGNFRHHTGILPIYLNSKIGFDITDNGKLFLSFGYGKSFQIGSENFKGFLRKYTISYGWDTKKENTQYLFIEINNHGFDFPDGVSATTLNLGLGFTFL